MSANKETDQGMGRENALVEAKIEKVGFNTVHQQGNDPGLKTSLVSIEAKQGEAKQDEGKQVESKQVDVATAHEPGNETNANTGPVMAPRGSPAGASIEKDKTDKTHEHVTAQCPPVHIKIEHDEYNNPNPTHDTPPHDLSAQIDSLKQALQSANAKNKSLTEANIRLENTLRLVRRSLDLAHEHNADLKTNNVRLERSLVAETRAGDAALGVRAELERDLREAARVRATIRADMEREFREDARARDAMHERIQANLEKELRQTTDDLRRVREHSANQRDQLASLNKIVNAERGKAKGVRKGNTGGEDRALLRARELEKLKTQRQKLELQEARLQEEMSWAARDAVTDVKEVDIKTEDDPKIHMDTLPAAPVAPTPAPAPAPAPAPSIPRGPQGWDPAATNRSRADIQLYRPPVGPKPGAGAGRGGPMTEANRLPLGTGSRDVRVKREASPTPPGPPRFIKKVKGRWD